MATPAANKSSYFAEKIIRRKLLVEGDGGNEDKKITNLLKSFLKFVDAPQGPET